MKILSTYHIGIYQFHDDGEFVDNEYWLSIPDYDIWGDTLVFIDDEVKNEDQPNMKLGDAIKEAIKLKKSDKYLAYLPVMIVTQDDVMLLETDHDIVEALLRFQ